MGTAHEIVEPRCQALNLSDSQRCTAQATAHDDLFCRFHARQCFGLYMGYKRRNAELDDLAAQAPDFLRASKTPLASLTFEGLTTEEQTRDMHEYLFRQYVLLGKVISARKLHHKHFFSLEMDYGHKAYLDKLVNTRHSVLKALENLERRTAQLLYEKERWYSWVRQLQDDEDQNREKEQKKVKLEAALFRRHWHEMEARLAAAREKEDRERQEAYLDEVWKERMAAESDDGAWDPIEDMVEEDRQRYLDLIRHFLWMNPPARDTDGQPEPEEATTPAPQDDAGTAHGDGEQPPSGATKPKNRGRKKKNKAGQSSEASSGTPAADLAASTASKLKKDNRNPELEPNKARIESKEEIRKRLREGVKKDYSHVNGPLIVGTANNPHELVDRSAPIKDQDISELIADITEIKMFLFCRQAMSHPALLPAALRANSVEEFLSDPAIADSDLRDLCLQVEQPTYEALRDACADFARGDEPDDDGTDHNDDKVDLRPAAEYIRDQIRYDDLGPDFLIRALGALYRESNLSRKQLLDAVAIGGGATGGERKMKVRICGRTVWNYASQKSMARAGWLHFSIMAKDCEFQDAISLCRNWDEFFELHILTLWQYFPASKWTGWSGNYLSEELTQMGFVPFHMNVSASENTTYNHLGSISRKTLRRQHVITESRNYVCAHMKRNDPVTRRFIQYAVMRPGEQFILVRDGIDGRIVVAPDKQHRWLVRSRRGVSATGRNQHDDNWDIERAVDPTFFAVAQMTREWHFNFESCYEIYMWDHVPGQSPMDMYHHIREMLSKARRIRGHRDKYRHMKYIMETLTREQDTKRVRQIKPGEKVKSLYDEYSGRDAEFWIKTTKSGPMIRTNEDIAPGVSPYLYYNDTDAAEDAVLFEEEMREGFPENMPFREIDNPLRQLEASHMPLNVMNKTIKHLEDSMPPELAKAFGVNRRLDGGAGEQSTDSSRSTSEFQPYIPGAGQFPYAVPPLWEQAYKRIASAARDAPRTRLLKRVRFSSAKLKLSEEDIDQLSDTQEIMERDRSYVYKDSFHLGDLEPGAQDRYKEAMDLIIGVQKYQSPRPDDHLDWAWLCLDLVDWINLELSYDDYDPEPLSPWPHRYIVQDVVQAFTTMALFFPGVRETSIIQEFLESEQGKGFKSSKIFDPAHRCSKRPDVRTRTSCSYRPKAFWRDWENLYGGEKHWQDSYPWDWNLTVKPILAKLYKAGMIAPAVRQATRALVPGCATASTEPHRPGQLDLFIKFYNLDDYWQNVPPTFIDYKDWPELLPAARAFAEKCKSSNNPTTTAPRFALIRLWSAPHFYPLMMTLPRRPSASFVDPTGRVWEWKFIPKDMALSEWSIHNSVMLRLGFLREQMMGSRTPPAADKKWAESKYSGEDKWRRGRCPLDERVVHRGDLVLVMGEDERELLRWCTVVAFALQTKPWSKEVDLWKSFINVDLQFLEGLEESWLD
ncbi:hypothetical protein N658DRAFT_511804 [Parathielavia hyrcaniae]|uniref:Mfs allantoate protein n=1 Tax=Parathielavia hyrcaniae TaxID=113614 RepID=A0AAN6SWB4_9PEZI|nr:hypothetical protein N658DRAFT_511804 [Parathielavia hyrcaniae]